MKVKPVYTTRKRSVIGFIAGLVALLAGAALAWSGHGSTLPVVRVERVVVARASHADWRPLVAAKANGYFTSDGIQARLPFSLVRRVSWVETPRHLVLDVSLTRHRASDRDVIVHDPSHEAIDG
ncbi:hypothetical protein DM992_38050 [Burkholderia sp. JP2-270]|uniref:hypothetical protein n=1 Tax=Burkholderia sp. JP2-270 TaxID=2217913 RepID=UPI000DA358B6|nr:hypothetical protein [Burkholderia sp. JP2-270]AWV05064.1 hypothetical protein DM992_38050 [Burkholderia sp. JP2-270]